ncbi:hypothetical protein BDL97_03G020900 [Sphagnum fallax]|nr:hypothetical protein BDL97_03G020900 [Sphagnum fallax]
MFADTIPPTAVVDAGQAYTNAVNVTVNITFSEVCDRDGGFVCPSTSSCDLLVYGAGVVVPSTFQEIEHGLVYSAIVMLSTQVPSGKATIVIAKRACADMAGNLFERSANSSFVIRFDRSAPSVNLWTAIPDSQVLISNQSRTIQATNSVADLIIFLDFSQPVTSTANELQQILEVSTGVLTSIQRRSFGIQRFGYILGNISSIAVVTVTLPGNRVRSIYGTLAAETTNTTFLFDRERPEVQLSTIAPAKTKSHIIPVLIQFTEPVFLFNSSGVTISGGNLTSFIQVSETTYALEVYIFDNTLMRIAVSENQTMDIAGNLNLASPILKVQHYMAPEVSVVLYFFTTAGLLTTALASAALSVSSASLAAAGAPSSWMSGSLAAGPSSNLLGMASHLQVFALSDWLDASLPIEYSETVEGLQWLIPNVRTPWQHSQTSRSSSIYGTHVVSNLPIVVQLLDRGGRQLLMMGDTFCSPLEEELGNYVHRGRLLGSNTSLFGPALIAGEYKLYFLSQSTNLESLKDMLNTRKYTGWQDFQRNMFWLAVVGGGLILLHVLTLLFLWWRTNFFPKGALSVPRFELFLLVLALPAMCQASAFTIRGGTEAGIGVGVLLLLIPASFLLSVSIFLIYGIFMGELVQYQETCNGMQASGQHNLLLTLLAGSGRPGKWFQKKGLDSMLLPRYGILFEDLKGPPTSMNLCEGNSTITLQKLVTTQVNRVEQIRTTSSNNKTDEILVSFAHKVLGAARSAYILIDLGRRILIGLLFGFYSGSGNSWGQVIMVLTYTVLQLLYLVVLKPFRKRGVQLAESISLLSQAGIFAAAIVLIARDQPTENHTEIGILMLVLLLVSFVAQFANVWHALMNRICHLASSNKPSVMEGLERLGHGFLLPFLPRESWSRFVNAECKSPAAVIPAAPLCVPDEEQSYNDQETGLRSPEQGFTQAENPLFSPEPSGLFHPRSMKLPANGNDDASPLSSVESPTQSLPGPGKQSGSRKRSKGSIKDTQKHELRMLQELARASFSPTRKDEEFSSYLQGAGGTGTTRSSPMHISSPIISPGQMDRRLSLHCRQIAGNESCTDDSLSNATFDGEITPDPLLTSVLETSYSGDAATSSSRRSIPKASRQQTYSHSQNLLPLRDAISPIRPLEER